MALALAERDGLFERPGAVGVQCDARLGEARLDTGDGLHLLAAGHDPALELEILEAVACVSPFGQSNDRLGRHRRLVADVVPAVLRTRASEVGKVGTASVTYVEEVGQHGHAVALLATAEQFCHRYLEVLAEQVEQGGLDGGDDIVQAQVDFMRLLEHGGLGIGRHLVSGGLRPAGGASGNRAPQIVENAVVAPQRLTDHQRPAVLQCSPNPFAARHFSQPRAAGAVLENHQVAGEPGGMSATEVEQHAVVTGDGNDLHVLHHRGCFFLFWHLPYCSVSD